MSLLVPAYPGCPGSKAVKRSLLLLLLLRRGSLAGTRNAMLLFRQLNRRPAGDPGGIKKPVSRDAYSLLHCTSLSTVRLNSCVKSALRITVCGGRIFSVLSFISRER